MRSDWQVWRPDRVGALDLVRQQAKAVRRSRKRVARRRAAMKASRSRSLKPPHRGVAAEAPVRNRAADRVSAWSSIE